MIFQRCQKGMLHIFLDVGFRLIQRAGFKCSECEAHWHSTELFKKMELAIHAMDEKLMTEYKRYQLMRSTTIPRGAIIPCVKL